MMTQDEAETSSSLSSGPDLHGWFQDGQGHNERLSLKNYYRELER